ncbi:serine hydrolase FSH [Sordaria brevicollis]|uniref:Serine hydrolase FSH n=1 Tax=Sordaria brevicollis TaxID=83679 RepID=A0AAE0PKR1_SORBR|nr:serine hydrolase FSH [Sordaria brevicollis]
MRFLCLPGAYGSSDKFQVQLAPIVKELTEDGTATFHFIHGPCKAVPPEGFEEYFGKPPYYRFIEPDQDVEKTEDDDVLARIRDFPDCESPEDTMRELMREGVATSHRSTDNALKYLIKIMDEQTLQEKGIKPMFKYAIFFAGWPPVDPDTHHMILSDESDVMIEIPTCHIIGSLDPYVHGSLALYNVCDPDTAYLFDHAKGHTLPRDKETVKELADVIRDAACLYEIHA